MRRLLIIFFVLASLKSFSQVYVSIAPQMTNTAGTVADRGNFAIEVGKQWDVFSLGFDIGKTTFAPKGIKDTSTYFEVRPNLNIFQEGKFTNTFTAGIGYVFKAKENYLTELTYSIEYSATPKVHVNIAFGQYFYSGLESTSSVTFFGLSLMYYFKPNKAEALITK